MLRWSCRRMVLSSRRIRHSRLEGTAHVPIVRSERLLGSGRLDNWTPMEPPYPSLEEISEELRACRLCRDAPRYGAPLPHEPRPAFQVSAAARLCIAGQAPGVRVHASARPFTDPSGVRLRQWLGIGEEIFYDPLKVAILFSGSRRERRRSAASPRMRRDLARAIVSSLAQSRARPAGRPSRPNLASRRDSRRRGID
jgi:hypothetical protein